MRNPIEVNGVVYNAWFKHRHIGQCHDGDEAFELYQTVRDCLKDAEVRGQVSSTYTYRTGGSEETDTPLVNGVTMCVIEDENRTEMARGYAFCSENDNFCKREGRNKALGRAVQYLIRKGS